MTDKRTGPEEITDEGLERASAGYLPGRVILKGKHLPPAFETVDSYETTAEIAARDTSAVQITKKIPGSVGNGGKS